jgi:lipoic acid synthetase
MVGLGETDDEIIAVMRDLRRVSCDLITLGQYLSPSDTHEAIDRYVTPDDFERLAGIAREMGFAGVASAPLVRSSFQAAELHAAACRKGEV